MNKNGQPEYLTPAEAAKILRVNRRTIYTWLLSGKLPARKFGGAWRISRVAISGAKS